MAVDIKTIEHVANLARLNLTDDEKKKLTKEMDDIVSYVDKLNELDTEGIVPREHVIPVNNVLREDEIKESFDREILLANAPDKDNGCFKVPKVVE
jgi:aspartyl-tRNA(Asn)/glutamyl-tRNA(Gln) amidotransferase subunit C